MGTFANVTAPNVGGAQSSVMTISNATLADSADYLVVLSNAYGMQTSFVATVMVLTTNSSILVGAGAGDSITLYTSDGSTGGSETVGSASDQTQQKWLSTGWGATGFDGFAVPKATIPFVGPAGYVVIPVNGTSIVSSIQFFCANDGQGRDPRDYLLEGSLDGSSWTTINGGQLLGTLMLPTARDTGGTGNTLNPFTQPLTEVDFANATPYSQYRVTITNNMEPVANALMQVAEIRLMGTLLPSAPVWVRQPEPAVTVFVGTSPTWGVLAGGVPAPKFQWFTNRVAALNATNSTFTLFNVQLADSGRTVFVRASNIGGTIESVHSTLTVIADPTESYPSAVLASGPMAYWRLNEGPDDSAGNNGVVTHDYAGGHNGYYSNSVIAVAGYNPLSDLNTAARFGDTPADSLVNNINNLGFARNANTPGATFSIEAWVLGGNQTVDGAILAKGYNGNLNPPHTNWHRTIRPGRHRRKSEEVPLFGSRREQPRVPGPKLGNAVRSIAGGTNLASSGRCLRPTQRQRLPLCGWRARRHRHHPLERGNPDPASADDHRLAAIRRGNGL